MGQYSHTRLSTYENCPLQYKLIYIDRLKSEEEGIEAFMGSRFHEAMEKLYADLKFGVPDLEKIVSYYDEQWDKNFTDKVVITKEGRTADDYRELGRTCIRNYYRTYHPFDQGTVIGIERQVTLDLNGDGKYLIKGYIDRLVQREDDTYEIHDYKTSGRMPTQKDADEDRQLALYQLAVEEMWKDVERVELVWHYVVFDKELRSVRTPEALEALKKEVASLIDEIEATTDFQPHESFLCDWCPFWTACPLKKHLAKTAELPPDKYKDEPGVKLVSRYVELEAEKDVLKTKIADVEAEQAKVADAAIALAEKEGETVLDGPGARLKVEIKDEMRAPLKSEAPEAWEKLRQLLIKEGRYQEVSTVNSNMLSYRLRNRGWPKELMDQVKKFLVRQIVKSVKLVRK